jgi:Fe2+ transport system protein B
MNKKHPVAKRRTKKTGTKQRSIKNVLVWLGMLFTGILFMIKIIIGGVGWFQVFAPVITVFFIVSLLSALKVAIKKI